VDIKSTIDSSTPKYRQSSNDEKAHTTVTPCINKIIEAVQVQQRLNINIDIRWSQSVAAS